MANPVPPMFDKILIANRGEIACRITRTARQMGIGVVAIYSDADEDSPHVAMADEAVRIGPAPAGQSYLAADAIVRACLETNAAAVHPGYGFLSENADFAERVAGAGLAFVGPRSETIRAMGDKIEAKRLAVEAGLNVVPGHPDPVESGEKAASIARDVGFPVMLKATAGGGGKGMRVVRSEDECRDEFDRAASEAKSSYGDGRILIEKFFEHSRHVEIQIVADQHGGIIHLGERESSLQRRHQKVVEESPSPLLTADMRAAMAAQSISLAKAANYESAGTVEFLVGGEEFYFLEMNTRLQVEHPVTELVTGVDLVELMIRIAAGERLPLNQDDVTLNGWAIESRVYAEDPSRGFLPSIGRLTRFIPPGETPSVRVDSGVREGSEVSLHYDPLLAKLVTHGATREEAIERTTEALSRFCIRGVTHNLDFLSALLENPRFRQGDLSTDMIAAEYPGGYDPGSAVYPEPELLAVLATFVHLCYRQRSGRISGQLPGYDASVPRDWVVLFSGKRFESRVNALEDGGEVIVGGERFRVETSWAPGNVLLRVSVNGREVCLQVERVGVKYRFCHRGVRTDVTVVSARTAELLDRMPVKTPGPGPKQLVSPMPGLLSRVFVRAGDAIRAGQVLAVVEAMKMENVLRADSDGIVDRVLVAEGDTLSVDQPIIVFAEDG